MKFVPLHVVTGYSFLQSGLTIERIETALKKNDYYGIGITDHEVMYGIPPFISMMKRNEKAFIVGEEFIIDGDTICLYAISEEGYHNLMDANLESASRDLTLEFLEEHKNGLICILETVRGKFRELFVEDYDSSFNKFLLSFAKIFKDNFYLGLEVTSREEFLYANRIRKFANQFTYNCVAFPRISYLKKDDAIIMTIVKAIANDEKIQEKEAVGQNYFMSEEDYSKIYTAQEIANTIRIVQKSQFDFFKKRGELLHYPVNNSQQELKEICYKNLIKLNLNDEKHKERLNYELSIIHSMGYDDYFLIVQDYVNYAKTHDILVGPGRGSAAGSLVSYLLGITEIDPLNYDLQFERFLNPYRKTMPDIDVDFMDVKRDYMVQYLREKYGNNRVANIVTFQTIGAKQAIRDIGRVYNYSNNQLDQLSKRLTNKDFGLRDSYKKLPDFRKLVDSDKYYLEIVSLASKIEGLPRQSGLHAAGVVIDDKPLTDTIPVTIINGDNYISQYEMEYLEEQGLLKMDFLSLSNLTIIYNCVNLINHRYPDAKLNPYQIPFDEPEIFKMISENKTMGLFQIDTQAMHRSISVLKPSNFNDVVALLALGRPGPMEYIPTYAKRKEGKQKFTYISDDLKEILEPTYGIIVYQEQINNIAMKMAGFTLGEADMFRRAVSKKDKTKLLGLEQQFVNGCLKKGYNQDTAKKVFQDILKFAEYGFNKSHSVVYSIIACRMAWLKLHYTLEFYCALFGSSSATSDNKFNDYISELKSFGYKLYSPSINYSSYNFVIKDNGLLYPLTGIKEISISITEKILKEREENGLFKDYFDFVLRMFKYKLNERHLQSLIHSGALDELYPSRSSMLLNMRSALQYAELNTSDDGQLSIGITMFPAPLMREEKDDPLTNLNNEYEVLGIMISDNPLTYKADVIKSLGAVKVNEAHNYSSGLVAGIVKTKKTINTKKGTPMAFVKIFDETGEMEVIVFSKEYNDSISLFVKNKIVLIKYTKQTKDGEDSYIANEIRELEEENNGE